MKKDEAQACSRCGQVKAGAPVMYPNDGLVQSVFACFDCLSAVRTAARRLRTGMEINGPTLEQVIAGDFQRLEAGQKDETLTGRPFVNLGNTALAKLHRRERISDVQYLAGDQYRTIWLRSGLNSRVSSAYGGGSGGGECTYGMAATEVVAHNRWLLRAAQRAIGKALDRSNGHEWLDILAVYDGTRIDVGYKVAMAGYRKVSRATAAVTGKKVIAKCLDALVEHFHIKAPEHYAGRARPWHGEVSEEARAAARRYQAEQMGKIRDEEDE